MFSNTQLTFFSDHGYLIVPSFENSTKCDQLLDELNLAIAQDQLTYPNVIDSGMVHNCFLRGDTLLQHLSKKSLREATDMLLCKNAIIYAYQSSSLRPGSGNYGSRIHVDCPRFVPGYRTNLGYILALDPFTHENGATWVLPGSHRSEKMPTLEAFAIEAIQLTCNSGDAIFFDSRLVHRAGENHTTYWRHAITINFCRPFMRSRFDFPRMVERMPWVHGLDGSARKFLGFDVRTPASLEQFYRPESERLYLPDQE